MKAIPDPIQERKSAEDAWADKLDSSIGLRILGASPLPPPSAGSACILEGSIPNPMGKSIEVASITFMLQGNPLVEVIDGTNVSRCHVKSGTFGIAPVGSTCQYRTEGKHTSLNLSVEDKSIQDFAQTEFQYSQSRVDLFHCIDATQPPDLFKLGLAFSKLIKTPRQGAALYAQSLWVQILLQLLWHHSSLASRPDFDNVETMSSSRTDIIMDFMEATLAKDISLSDLAGHVGLSSGYFLRSFKKTTGKTPFQYRLDLRLSKACELLSDVSLEISDIAAMLGFSSHSQFSSAFRRRMGVTPSVYRKSVR